MRILLLGGNGQVGWELQRSLSPLGEVFVAPRSMLDICDHESVGLVWEDRQPDVVINAAAYTAVDEAEAQPEKADAINHLAPAALARLALKHGSLLVHYSSDYVFDGLGQSPFNEQSPMAPVNAYGRSKRAGDEAIMASGCRHLIFRTSWVHASRGRNFIRSILRLARERDRLQVVSDQHGSPTSAELIADITAHVIAATRDNDEALGLYHLAAGRETTWFEIAHHAVVEARRLGMVTTLAPEALEPIFTQSYPTPAIRPLNSRLDTSKLRQMFGLSLPHWTLGVDRTVAELVTA